ncbi:hypothetical protein [Schleiferilactobacillus shenzhenensis]|uniref:Uncharacterized protein n=1 Tax=Schleiferilactobacillus shenzhenensis LY-73 TaxID=1231336 RepID=U4TUK5_9LACO|nr:hypothetical protein [Schleiferilactobacillus shenzhenensis]ERL65112.1 hypothetical protein L248_3050 [Schleiferilactobacillus shenzhenensis LY-73]
MFYWLVVFVGFLALLAGTQWLLAWLKQRGIHINRWLFGLLAFLVLIVPHVLMKQVPPVLDGILYGLCAVFAVAFMTESHALALREEKEHGITPKH